MSIVVVRAAYADAPVSVLRRFGIGKDQSEQSSGRATEMRRRRKRVGGIVGYGIGGAATGPLPCVPETRVETRLTITERQRLGGRARRAEGRREDGNRKPRGAEFASGKATSDYFI